MTAAVPEWPKGPGLGPGGIEPAGVRIPAAAEGL